jgi:hypothetical protein
LWLSASTNYAPLTLRFVVINKFLDSLLTNGLALLNTKTMGHSRAAETNRFPASQKSPCVLLKPTAFYRVHKSPPIIRLQPDKSNPCQTILFEIHCNIFHPNTPPAVSEGVYFLQVSPPISCTHFSSPMLVACPAHLILLGFHKLIIHMNSVILVTVMKQGI